MDFALPEHLPGLLAEMEAALDQGDEFDFYDEDYFWAIDEDEEN